MTLLIVSFIAGVLTILAPCILPLLPVIIGGSVSDVRSKMKPYVITASLVVSVIVFTLVLKASTVFIDIPAGFWKGFSGGILIAFGVAMLFPGVWEKLSSKLSFGVGAGSQKLLAQGSLKKSYTGDILMGAALGPVFTSCSPTYFVILATVLPESFARGFVYLLAYAVGLGMMLLLIALLGQKFVGRLQSASDPRGWFKRTLGVLFLLVGLAVFTGYDKELESRLLDLGVYDGIGGIEEQLLENVDDASL